jgi:hypothetical protein
MWTRSKILKVQIDFDKAHSEWMKNKKKLGNGTYQYIPEKTKNEYLMNKK